MRTRSFGRLFLSILAMVTLLNAQDVRPRHPRRPRISTSPVLALINGTLIDGTGAGPVANAIVLVRDGKIIAAGAPDAVPVPSDAELIDAAGAYVLPGFINAHVHNALRPDYLKLWAHEGVTTVRDVGAAEPYATVFRTRNGYRADPQYARLLAAGPLVTVPNGYPLIPNHFPALAVLSVEDARTQIRQVLEAGADLIKITLEPASGLPTLTLEEAAAIVEEAHSHGVPVTVHATRATMYRRALDAGVDDICHSAQDRVSDEMIAEMIQKGVAMVPTLTAQKKAGESVPNLQRFLASGGKVALGNDGGYLAGLEVGMPITELQALQDAGMTPMQIIVASTRTAAGICRLDRSLGTLERSKQADILVVRRNPLDDLRALLEVQLVMHSGVIIRRAD